MTTTHAIIAAPWQLEQPIQAILLPLKNQPRLIGDYWFWSPEVLCVLRGKWNKDEKFSAYKDLRWQVGDLLYLQEPWCKGNWGDAFDDIIYFTESTYPEPLKVCWQPAETMPEAAAEYRYEIVDVQVIQMKEIECALALHRKLTRTVFETFPPQAIPGVTFEEAILNWNKAHPDHTWRSDLWVVNLKVKILEGN